MSDAKRPQFASRTEVSVEKTELEIRALLKRYGATGLLTGFHRGFEVIAFELEGLHIRFTFETPTEADCGVRDNGTVQSRNQIAAAVEQARRTLWRELLLNIKSKLVMASSRYRTVEQEFMADIVLPNDFTMYEWTHPQLRAMLAGGEMPKLLPRKEK